MKNGKPVILCVDDDQDTLDAIRVVLEAGGYVMEEAATGEEGVRQWKACKPDVVIVDLMMEEVDAGVNCVRELRLAGNTAPVYMLSSVGDQLNQIANYAELGLAGVFQKPVQPARLLAVLKAKLATRK
ncbi:MAG: Alkaline phosphatase synthesis transcriptional regulatory protein PhoP [Lentisphaerae bacterium ADurb.BinA184]|nr:MAG: Alkaline phosphatase synthesis transcriptional regulatory protein PhoP [Lentisphaerae bacterium ADurb.BinA184]